MSDKMTHRRVRNPETGDSRCGCGEEWPCDATLSDRYPDGGLTVVDAMTDEFAKAFSDPDGDWL